MRTMRSLQGLLSLFGFIVGLFAIFVLTAFTSGNTRSDYAFVDGRSTSPLMSPAETPLLLEIAVPFLCAALGWLTAFLLVKRGWALTRTA